jgi:hypothetical protein
MQRSMQEDSCLPWRGKRGEGVGYIRSRGVAAVRIREADRTRTVAHRIGFRSSLSFNY